MAMGLDSVLSTELKDLDYSSWRGKSLDEVQATDPDGVRRWLTDIDAAPHGGESIRNFLARIGGWLAGQHGSGHTLAVTHPAVVRAAVVLTLQAPAQSFWRIDIPPVSIVGAHVKVNKSEQWPDGLGRGSYALEGEV